MIVLSPEQYAAAIAAGDRRRDFHGYALDCEKRREQDRIGAVAEYALALFLGDDVLQRWIDTQAFAENYKAITCDVGTNLHVRATGYKRGRLLVRQTDPDDGVFVCAIVDGPTVQFPGWLYAYEAKLPDYWDASLPKPAYGVPQHDLHPFVSLPQEAIR